MRVFGQDIVADAPLKIKDVAMAELLRSLQQSAQDSLTYLSLSHTKINSNANAEALGKLISVQARWLETIQLEEVFGTKKLFGVTFGSLRSMSCG